MIGTPYGEPFSAPGADRGQHDGGSHLVSIARMDQHVSSQTTDKTSAKRRRQFSLRALLILTTLLSVILALAVNFPYWFWIVALAAAMLAGLQAIVGFMTRVASIYRPPIALIAWLYYALFFVFLTWAYWIFLDNYSETRARPTPVAMCLIPAVCALHCFLNSWRTLIRVIYAEP
jgi:apolipoprotein N-acyltransferase